MDETLLFRPILKRVFLIHILFVAAVYFISPSTPMKPERVQVKTIRLAPQGGPKVESTPKSAPPPPKAEPPPKSTPTPPKAESPPKSAPKVESAPKKEKAQPKKKEALKKVEKAKPAEQPKKVEATKSKDDRKAVLKKVQESVAKMESMEATSPQGGKPGLKPIERLTFEGFCEEGGYVTDMTMRLKAVLHLPEYGQVRLYLTVLRSGRVDSFEVVDSASRLNKNYLDRALRELALPPFGKWYPQEEKHTFALTLSNEYD